MRDFANLNKWVWYGWYGFIQMKFIHLLIPPLTNKLTNLPKLLIFTYSLTVSPWWYHSGLLLTKYLPDWHPTVTKHYLSCLDLNHSKKNCMHPNWRHARKTKQMDIKFSISLCQKNIKWANNEKWVDYKYFKFPTFQRKRDIKSSVILE